MFCCEGPTQHPTSPGTWSLTRWSLAIWKVNFGVFRIGPYGQPEAQEDPAFLGNGRVAAAVAWNVATEMAESASVEERLQSVMHHTVEKVTPLRSPIRYWRVSSVGIAELAPDENVANRWP